MAAAAYAAFTAAATVSESGIKPRTYNKAKKSADWLKWQKAMEEEHKSFTKNNVWQWQQLPLGKKPLDTKWVYKLKTNVDGNPVRQKARLVAKGFQQEVCVNFNETFAAVVKLKTQKLFFTLVALYNLECDQVDIVTTFLNKELKDKDEIYVEPPQKQKQYRNGQKIYQRLRKTLYGLK